MIGVIAVLSKEEYEFLLKVGRDSKCDVPDDGCAGAGCVELRHQGSWGPST